MNFLGRFLGRLLLGWTCVAIYCYLFYAITKDYGNDDPLFLVFFIWLFVGFFLLRYSPMKYANPIKAIIKDFSDNDTDL
ncbi:hypothetical protein [Bacillus sp. FSL M7-0417]|uniref:hypothetical protein n=1 Tax=Bacillus sp. FSL M7-0417 TaxID=2921532 RepID=UPI0030F6869B